MQYMSEEGSLLTILQKEFSLDLGHLTSREELTERLSVHINDLINHNFDLLVGILYRIDISEKKLGQLLGANPGRQAPLLIAELIIDRQLQKIETRKEFSAPKRPDSDEEKW